MAMSIFTEGLRACALPYGILYLGNMSQETGVIPFTRKRTLIIAPTISGTYR